MQFVHLTALEQSYTPEPCNIFVKVRPVLHYTVVLQHNVHMCIAFTLSCILKIPVILVFSVHFQIILLLLFSFLVHKMF